MTHHNNASSNYPMSNDSKFTRLKQAMALQKSKDSELKMVFTPEQYKQYEKIEDELKGKLKQKM